MGREKNIIGRYGEQLALDLLKNRGYVILERNFRTPFGELDAVARQNDYTVFIEIKTRTSSSLGPPYLSVTAVKKRHIIKSALSYLKMRGGLCSNWRVDVVSVNLNHRFEIENIEVIENAVEGWI